MGRFLVKDTFFLKAKKDGFRARSAYKLIEIQKKFHVIKKGDKVLDLGCSPGSFIQVIREIVGEEGLVVGIDILDTQPFFSKNIIVLKGDILKIDISAVLSEYGIDAFDVITSDISPNISGIREVDEKNRRDVYDAIKRVVSAALREGGNLVMKSFFTESFSPLRRELDRTFSEVFVHRPEATRRASSEVYLVCLRKRSGQR